MTVVASLVSERACELIHGQYTYALGPASYTVDEGCPDVYFLKSVSTEDDALDEVNAEYSVTKRDWNCFGLFMSTRLLPCRHLRKALGDDTVIPTQLLNGRWLFSSVRSAIEFNSSSDTTALSEPFAVRPVLPDTDRPWDNHRKYREALPIATGICDGMAGLGMPQYHAVMNYLQEVARQFKRGDKSAWVSSMNKYQHQATIRAGNPSSESGNHSGETGNHSSEAGNHSAETDELSANTEMSSQMMGVRSGSVE
ncbi:hypothetical protein PR002_g21461 [Phytophthora rubi]|uniref:Uncharacterized protein n=1 Tax=Phytophthora rubi TaxID=129364 RepID=A0A6A3JAK0_9STRA|nr:hypothetical protein PR002_g21461 [Phytophthora rubi]